jgi:dTDP-4-dehydrorhamnose reductase
LNVAERVLVLGATGMLGHVVARRLATGFEVHSGVRDVERARRLGIAGELHAFDAMDGSAVDLIAALRPAAVINAVGLVKQLEEASRPVPAITINALFPHVLAEASASAGARLVHVSTDCVFSGELAAPAAYSEDDAPDPKDLYGRSKLLGEVTAAPGLTLRTSIIGWEPERASGLLEWFASQRGNVVNGFTGAIFSGVTTETLAAVIDTVLRDHPDLSGLYHVSAEPISKLELLNRLADVLGMPCEIRPVDEPRINRALDSSRFREATGIEIPGWEDMLAVYRKETHDAHA